MTQQVPVDVELLELLVCPSCRSRLALDYESNHLVCTSSNCGLAYPLVNGVPVLLVGEARKPS